MKSEKKENIFLPVSLNITGRKILIVGGGRVAAHKMQLLSRFSMNLTILAPKICEAVASEKFNVIIKKYESSDLKGYFLIYACTDDNRVNEQIKDDANKQGILVNVADNPALCDFVSPAIYKQDELTVAVGSNAQNVRKSIAVRDKISQFLKKESASEPDTQLVQKYDKCGKVTLVGFGPGNPELLTLKAAACLKEADVIYYDALIDQTYLNRFSARKVPVGKRYGMHSKQQDEINELLLESASTGLNVVRLKGGDPMIFGRANEEIDFLCKNGIKVEVVPGITTALAASAQYFIPLTQRFLSSSVAFYNGHNLTGECFPISGTLVFYMGANCQTELAEKLILQGWDKNTPVALMSRISFPDSIKVVVTLGKLALKEALTETPLLIIVSKTIPLN